MQRISRTATRAALVLAAALSLLIAVGQPASAHGYGSERTYRVTVTNLTSGQYLTPPLVAAHRGGFRAFRVGHRASPEIRQIAENGNLDPAVATWGAHPRVSDVVAAGGPVGPGASATIEFSATRHEARRVSLASMLICSNDGFSGVNRLRLPRHVGATNSAYAFGFDAGTEINTEDFADIVPPCPALSGVPTTDSGSGMSDPALAEGGRIRHHGGVVGGDDLQPEVHGWNPAHAVIAVSVERIG